MIFTYGGYLGLLKLLEKNRYNVVDYHNWEQSDRCVILRHDVDNDLQKALEMAKLEHRYGIQSTYFVLLTSNLYNMFSNKSREMVNEMRRLGHTIGLHFDEMVYQKEMGNIEKVEQCIRKELDILSEVVETEVTVFSYHRPTKMILNADITMPNVINAYGSTFFKDFKYISDSRRHWREPVEEIIRSGGYLQLQILTHPFWYDSVEKGMKEIMGSFINRACVERYDELSANFTNLSDVIDRGGIGS